MLLHCSYFLVLCFKHVKRQKVDHATFLTSGTPGMTMTSSISNSRPRLGETITLSCSIVGGTSRFMWWESKQQHDWPVVYSYNCAIVFERPYPRLTKIRCDESSLNLMIRNVQISDRGIWECGTLSPVLPHRATRSSIELDVLVPPLTPTVTNPSPVKVGETAKLTCNAENDSVTKPVTYTWIKNGITVSPGTTEPGTLLLSPVKKGNAGKYVCVAKNDDGSKTSAEQDFVVYFPHDVQIITNETTVSEHESVRFECATSGGYPGHIEWYQWLWKKRGFTAEHVILDTETNERFLAFARIPYDRSGTYYCKAWNLGGMGQASSDLNVQYSPRIDPNAKTKYVVVGEIGEEASFELLIISNPTPTSTGYFWSKDGNILSNSSPEYEIISGPTSSRLKIRNIKSSDYTNYTCTVKTSKFQAEVFQFKLLKAGPPSAPTNLKVVNSTAVATTLSWISEFNGGSEQRYYVQYRKSAESWDVASEVPQGGITDPGLKKVVYHKVRDLESNVLYQFRVRSKNSHPVTSTSNFSNTASEKTPEKPQTALIGVSRTDNKVAVRWRQVTEKYTAIKINYCQIDTGDCMNYTVPNPEDKSATFSVDANKTYYYYMIIEDGGDVIYRSRVINAIKNEVNETTSKAVIEGLVGACAVVVGIAGVIMAVFLWKRELVRRGKSQSHQPANDTVDYNDKGVEFTTPRNSTERPYANMGTLYANDERIEFTTPRNSTVRPYANIGTLYVNDAFHPALTASQSAAQPEITGHHVPEHGVLGKEPLSSDDDDNEYEYVASYTIRQPVGSGRNSPICTQGQQDQKLAELGSKTGEAYRLTPSSSTDDVAHGQASQYEHLEPVERAPYLDFRQLSQEQLRPI